MWLREAWLKYKSLPVPLSSHSSVLSPSTAVGAAPAVHARRHVVDVARHARLSAVRDSAGVAGRGSRASGETGRAQAGVYGAMCRPRPTRPPLRKTHMHSGPLWRL